jgi:hypothetical protein
MLGYCGCTGAVSSIYNNCHGMCIFCITIPVGAILTIWTRIDLIQWLTFAMVVGYTITAMILSLVVLTSDWQTLSTAIKEIVDDNKKSQCHSMVPVATSDGYLSIVFIVNILNRPSHDGKKSVKRMQKMAELDMVSLFSKTT